MAIQTLTRTYQSTVNNIAGPDGTQAGQDGTLDRRTLIFGIISEMIDSGTFTAEWTVSRSCDAVSVSATNLWTDVTKVKWNTVGLAHSWIVTFQAALGLYVCYDLVQSTGNDGAVMNIVVSRNAFTGGSTTARPTANEEMNLITYNASAEENKSWGAGSDAGTSTPHRFVYSVFISTDGLSNRVLIWYNNVPLGFWFFEKPGEPPENWSTPVICGILGDLVDTGGSLSVAEMFSHGNVSDLSVYAYHPTRLTTAGVTASAPAWPLISSSDCGALGPTSTVLTTLNNVHPITGNHINYPFTWFTNASSVRGKLGDAVDMFFVADNAGVVGDTVPSSGTLHQLIRHGCFLLPWQAGTAPVLS